VNRGWIDHSPAFFDTNGGGLYPPLLFSVRMREGMTSPFIFEHEQEAEGANVDDDNGREGGRIRYARI